MVKPILKDDFFLKLDNIEATDHMEYGCNDSDTSISGWKFVILRYYINNTGKEPIHILPGSLVDENGVSYSNFDSDCLTKNDDFDYSKDVPPMPKENIKFGNLVYKCLQTLFQQK